MKELNKSRRKFMKLSLGAIGLGGLAHYSSITFNFESFIRSTLTSLLGNFNIAEKQMRKFCHDFVKKWYKNKKFYAIIILKQVSALQPIAEKLFRVQAHWVIEKFERRLLTEFVLSTNYLKVGNPATDSIEYHGMNIPCNNPFAKLDYVKH